MATGTQIAIGRGKELEELGTESSLHDDLEGAGLRIDQLHIAEIRVRRIDHSVEDDLKCLLQTFLASKDAGGLMESEQQTVVLSKFVLRAVFVV